MNPLVNTANNKLTGTTYDAAGNAITDAEGRQFTYDAENKQVEVENGSSQLIGQYYFDGDGKRVKKVVPSGETTIFVYDASGRLIGEYSTEVQPMQDAKTQYLTADHLGTPRINTNGVGAVVSRSDYMPYGEEITSGRSGGQGYVVDDVRQGFTGYENDDETGLDFAQARMYSVRLGRFSTTDPSARSIDRVAPQTWHRYNYCYNNPLTLVDENGKWPQGTHRDLVRYAFGGLSNWQITLVQAGTRRVDYSAEGKPLSTLWPSEAHKHAMTPDGMTSDEAKSAAQKYLNEKLAEVRALQKGYESLGNTGLSGSALIALGEATHVYEDMTSPAHGFDKVYAIPMKTITILMPDGSEFATEMADIGTFHGEMDAHKDEESRSPNIQEIRATVDRSRAFFLLAFGEKEFNKLVMSDEERERARKIAKDANQ